MDALAQLALMTKAKLVFESPDTFLSFPALIPKSYTPDQMKFSQAASTQELAEFSVLTNALPQGTLFQPSLDHVLWDVYQGVLQNAQVAEGTLTAQQTAELQAAQSFLSVQGPDGLLVDSPAAVAYKQYQQAWFAATQNYNNQKITASASADPNVQAQWKNNGEPLARAQVDAAESDWEIKGFKAQVDQAKQAEQTYAAQSPQLKWQSWKDLCIPVIDLPFDATTNTYFGPTVFAPYDICDHGGWPSFSISGSDIPNLVNQAPAELKNIFGRTSGNSTIDSLSFEYCSVALIRPWFRPDLFYARFWRLPDATVQLSDGSDPPQGDWPAYITAVVFARNIVVTTHGAGAVQPQPVRSFPPLMVADLRIQAAPAPKPMPMVLRPQIAMMAQPAAPTKVAAQPIAMRAAPVTMIRPMMMERTMAVSSAPMARMAPVAEARPQVAPVAATRINPTVMMRLNAATFSRTPVPAPGPATPPPPPPPSQTQSSGAQISVLAFICKRLPKCPNPDPALNWG